MTRSELLRLVKKLYYRRRLSEELSALENQLSTYLEVNRLTRLNIPGFQIELGGAGVIISELPKVSKNQLSLIPDYYCLEEERR